MKKQTKTVVTGSNGFIGSHLVKRLDALGFDLGNGDVRDLPSLLEFLLKYRIERVYHLAALPLVVDAFKNPMDTYLTNTVGTLNVLEASRILSIETVIITTDKVYGECIEAREDDPLVAGHPYDTSKTCADLIAQSYMRAYGLPITILRYGNVYGEGDTNYSRIVPGIMESLILDRPLIIRSSGNLKRDYIYIDDVIKGTIKAQERRGIYNISSDENLTPLEIIDLVERVLGKKVKYIIQDHQNHELMYQSISYDKIRQITDWEPTTQMADRVPKIFKWYEKQLK